MAQEEVNRVSRTGITGNSGLTLIELMLAVSLIALGSIMLLAAFPAIRGTIESSEDMAQAVYNGTTVMEEIKALPSTSLPQFVPPTIRDLGGNETISVLVVSNSGDEVALPRDFSTIAGGVPDPVELRVRVAWTDDAGRRKTMTLASKKSIS
jgi:Tfp pilus assembly protein PilV